MPLHGTKITALNDIYVYELNTFSVKNWVSTQTVRRNVSGNENTAVLIQNTKRTAFWDISACEWKESKELRQLPETWDDCEGDERRVRRLREQLKFGGVRRRRTKTTSAWRRRSGLRMKGRRRDVVDDEQSVNIMEAIPLAGRSYQSIKLQGFRVFVRFRTKKMVFVGACDEEATLLPM